MSSVNVWNLLRGVLTCQHSLKLLRKVKKWRTGQGQFICRTKTSFFETKVKRSVKQEEGEGEIFHGLDIFVAVRVSLQ